MPPPIVSTELPIVSSQLPHIKVAGLLADTFACGHYRMIHPFHYLSQSGMECQLYTTLNTQGLMKADIIVAQRQHAPEIEQQLKVLKNAGKKIFYEVDDNLHAVMKSSPVYDYYHTGTPACKGVERILSFVDGCTVSTPELADFYSKFCPNIRVVPNTIDFELRDWVSTPKDKDPNLITIGWSGSTTHAEDLELLSGVIGPLLSKYDHVRFALYTENNMAIETIHRWKLDLAKVILISPRPFKEYPTGLGYFDIGLAPIVNTPFNACKSPLKFLEYGARGIPCVASRVAPYARAILPGENGFTAHTPAEWTKALTDLIESKELRKEMGQAAQQYVKTHFDLGKSYKQWFYTWRELSQNPITKVRKPVYGHVERNEPCPCGRGKKLKNCCKEAW